VICDDSLFLIGNSSTYGTPTDLWRKNVSIPHRYFLYGHWFEPGTDKPVKPFQFLIGISSTKTTKELQERFIKQSKELEEWRKFQFLIGNSSTKGESGC